MARKLEVQIVGDARDLERTFGRASNSAGGFGRALKTAGFAAAAAGGAMAAGLAVAGKKAMDFEREMRNVNSIAKLSETQFARVSDSVLSMAREVGQKPRVLAQGLYELTSSGFAANDAVKILKVSAKAASAGLTDTATSTKAVAAALNAYHLKAKDARKVSDILFQTVNKGVLTFEELAQNMGDMVPAAAPLGVSLEEVGASISTITLQGVPAAEAATRVKNAMLQLAKPSKGLSALLRENGYESGEAAVKAVGFSGVLQMLQKATQGSVTETAKLTPEIRSLMGVVGLTGKNLATYEANLRAMKDASKDGGATQAAFAEQSKSVSVQLQKLSAGFEVLAIRVGSVLLPHLTALLDWTNRHWPEIEAIVEGAIQTISTAIKRVTHILAAVLPPAFSAARAAVAEFVAVGKEVLNFFDGTSGRSVAAQAALAGFVAVVVTGTVAIKTIAAVTKVWAAAQLVLNAVMAANPFVLIAAALVGLGVALVVAYKRSEEFRKIVNGAFEAVKAVVLPIIKAVQDAWKRWGDEIRAVAAAVLGVIKAWVQNVIGVFRIIIAVLQGDWSEAWNQLKGIVSRTLGAIVGVVRAIGPLLLSAAKALGQALIDGIVSGLSGIADAVANKIKGGISSAIDKVKGAFKIFSPSKVTADEIGIPLGEGVLEGINKALDKMPEKMRDKMMEGIDAARQAVESSRGIFAQAFDALVSQALSAFDKLASEIETRTERQLRLMDEKARKQQLKQDISDARRGLADAQAAFAAVQPGEGESQEDFAARMAEATANIMAAQKALDEALAAQQRANLEAQAARERKQLNERLALKRKHFEDELAALQSGFERGKLSAKAFHEKLIALFKEYNIPFRKNSRALGLALAEGFNDAFDEVRKAARALAQEVLNAFEGIVVRINVDLQHVDGKPPGKRALGGPVNANSPYIVGEKGPEMFVPDVSGRIIPNNKIQASTSSVGGGGSFINLNFYGPAVGTSREFEDVVRRAIYDVQRRNPGSGLAFG